MSEQNSIHKKQQTLARLERHYALAKVKEHKRDTRRKIEFGGLVIKANMDQYPKEVILGALISAANQLEHDEATYRLFQYKGEAAFLNYGEKQDG